MPFTTATYLILIDKLAVSLVCQDFFKIIDKYFVTHPISSLHVEVQ